MLARAALDASQYLLIYSGRRLKDDGKKTGPLGLDSHILNGKGHLF